MREKPGVAIVGCGLIGEKRASHLGAAQLVACVDTVQDRSIALADRFAGARSETDWRETISAKDVDIVIVCTTNDMLTRIGRDAVLAGKHVLIEKPAARSMAELQTLIEAADQTGCAVRVGFNHRYHPSIRKARDIYESGVMGRMMFIRGRYGHGGRIGYEKEWRADPQVSGGGELLDQGVHLIDLSRWFLGDFERIHGQLDTCFWKMAVEDNAFMTLQTNANTTAFLHVTWTEWKNLFCMELYGTDAKLQIDGLGGSYGPESLTYYKMLPEMGPPEVESWQFTGPDDSWETELQDFIEDIRLGRTPSPGLEDAAATMRVVDELYRQNPRFDY